MCSLYDFHFSFIKLNNVSPVIYIHCPNESLSEFRPNSPAFSIVRRNLIPVVAANKVPNKTRRDPTIDRGCRANERVSRRKVGTGQRFVVQTGRAPDVFTSARCQVPAKNEISNRQSGPRSTCHYF